MDDPGDFVGGGGGADVEEDGPVVAEGGGGDDGRENPGVEVDDKILRNSILKYIAPSLISCKEVVENVHPKPAEGSHGWVASAKTASDIQALVMTLVQQRVATVFAVNPDLQPTPGSDTDDAFPRTRVKRIMPHHVERAMSVYPFVQ